MPEKPPDRKNRRMAVAAVAAAAVLAALGALIFYVRPPGEPAPEEVRYRLHEAGEPYMASGDLPGVTWVDDIHPIFTRNVCIFCHTRGREAIAEGLEEFALGLVDPEDERNAFYSYHELVYAEGPPRMMAGETLRDGQCCWPRGSPPDLQRRIWLGRAERSALVRKLERDYYDWRKPPRYFEEGIRLRWGLPMPMYFKERHDGGTAQEAHAEHFEIRPFYERIIFRLGLWLGMGRDRLRQWPPRIPARDRELIRYWINNASQVEDGGTGIEIAVVNGEGSHVEGAVVRLVGNYNSPERREVADVLALRTDSRGGASLYFPAHSVISVFWYASAAKDGAETGYRPLKVNPGEITKAVITLPGAVPHKAE